MDNSARLLSMLDRTISSGTLKKITLSKPSTDRFSVPNAAGSQ